MALSIQTKNPFKINSGVWIVSKTEMNVLGSIVYKSKSGVDQVSKKGAALT
jgi:exo-beta-1,3-glucanase (GH17 family)